MEWVTVNYDNTHDYELTAWNSRVFIHERSFRHLDHVRFFDKEEEFQYTFDRKLVHVMMDADLYSFIWFPFPDDDTIELYNKFRAEFFDLSKGEIDQFSSLLDAGLDWSELLGDDNE